jgi:hypothetical protein
VSRAWESLYGCGKRDMITQTEPSPVMVQVHEAPVLELVRTREVCVSATPSGVATVVQTTVDTKRVSTQTAIGTQRVPVLELVNTSEMYVRSTPPLEAPVQVVGVELPLVGVGDGGAAQLQAVPQVDSLAVIDPLGVPFVDLSLGVQPMTSGVIEDVVRYYLYVMDNLEAAAEVRKCVEMGTAVPSEFTSVADYLLALEPAFNANKEVLLEHLSSGNFEEYLPRRAFDALSEIDRQCLAEGLAWIAEGVSLPDYVQAYFSPEFVEFMTNFS